MSSNASSVLRVVARNAFSLRNKGAYTLSYPGIVILVNPGDPVRRVVCFASLRLKWSNQCAGAAGGCFVLKQKALTRSVAVWWNQRSWNRN